MVSSLRPSATCPSIGNPEWDVDCGVPLNNMSFTISFGVVCVVFEIRSSV